MILEKTLQEKFGCLVGWLLGWLVGCLVGWLVAWLVDWLAGRLLWNLKSLILLSKSDDFKEDAWKNDSKKAPKGEPEIADTSAVWRFEASKAQRETRNP